MDIFEPQQQNTNDLITFAAPINTTTTTTQSQTTATTTTNANTNGNLLNFINHSQNSTSSGYNSGRSTPNTLLNRLNKLQNQQQQQQQQQLLPSLDDFLFDNNEFLLMQHQQTQQQQTPKHQQQLQLLNNEIQNHLFNGTGALGYHHHHHPQMSASYRSLSLNNVILQSPTRQIIDPVASVQYAPQATATPQPPPYNSVHNTNQQYRRERSLDRSLSSTLLTPSTTSLNSRQRSFSAKNRDDTSNSNNNNNNMLRHDLSTNSIKSLLLQQQQQQQVSTPAASSKINYSKELQIRIIDMQKEINYLKCELELTSQKLQSSVQSIKTFWSPELKKERQARKEEAAKFQNLYEKYKMLVSAANSGESSSSPLATTNENLVELQQQQHSPISGSLNKLIKENNLLKKTIGELELRINTQKQVIASKDDTIKNLFLLLNKDNAQQQQQQILDANEFSDVKECLNNTIDQQAQHIKYLENQNQIFQDELKLIQQTPLATSTTSLTTQNQIELYKTNEKFFKEKIESLKFDLNRKENEIQTLKTKYESIENKEKDLQHYLNLLKESISTKDQQSMIVQSEINDLRNRLRDKEAAIEKKQQQIQTFQLDKHQRDSDILELRDQMDIKERKLNVLNRKIDNLEEQLKDKELQIQTLRTKLGTNTTSMNYTNEIINLEHVIDEKEKIIEKYKNTSKEQLDGLNTSIQELKEINEKKDKEIIDYQNEILDLKDELNILKTQLIHKDSHVNSLELSLTQKHDEMEKIEEKLNRLKQQQQFSTTQLENQKKQVMQLQKDLQAKETQLSETLKELHILKDLISNFELQKEEMMNKLEQQQQVFDNLQTKYEQQIKQQQENNHANMVNSNSDNNVNRARISELEDALRQSVAITAEREIVMAKQKAKLEKTENENKHLASEIEKMKKYLNEQQFQFERLQDDFIKREEQLQQLEEEKVKEMNEILIAKQEALLTAISEKDSNIANLEVDNYKTQTHLNEINRLYEEKDHLHQQLKQLNEKRMKLMQDHMHSKDAKDKVKMLVLSIKTANDEDGVYA